jgi:MoxR-like ATPase
VTIEGLPSPSVFTVCHAEPDRVRGTPASEAQLDRFLFKIHVPAPSSRPSAIWRHEAGFRADRRFGRRRRRDVAAAQDALVEVKTAEPVPPTSSTS